MFKSIEIKNGVKHHNKKYEFKNGITAIVGENGAGKSLIVEFLTFSLFGVQALRGKSDEYPKGFSVTVDLEIKDKGFQITRTLKDCKIFNQEGEQICVGTKACNTKIIELLSYGYPVYLMSNYAKQGEINELGKMKPSDRKAAIDSVLGLGVIDAIAKVFNDDGNKYLAEASGMVSGMRVPEAPVMPEGYKPQDMWRQERDERQSLDSALQILVQACPVENEEPKEPVPAYAFEPHENSEYFKAQTTRETELLRQKQFFEGLSVPSFTEEELQGIEQSHVAYEAYRNYLIAKNKVPSQKPEVLLEEAERGIKNWKIIEDHRAQKAKWEAHSISCPSCSYQFSLEGIKDPGKLEMAPPEKERSYYEEQIRLHKLWKGVVEPTPVAEAEPPKYDLKFVADQRKMFHNIQEKEKMLPSINSELSSLIGISERAEAWNRYNTDVQVYITKMEHHQKNKEDRKINLAAQEHIREQLKDKKELSFLETKLQEAIVYDNQFRQHQIDLQNYLANMEKVKELETKSAQYKLTADRLKEFKLRVKQHVVPSLMVVASNLCRIMSEGAISNVYIDEGFEMNIDGKSIILFSESEQAIINLALRIGLGQVLTHKAFNVFIGDEIDASMREERAEQVAFALKRLSANIEQIILVSHRNIEADHYVTVGRS